MSDWNQTSKIEESSNVTEELLTNLGKTSIPLWILICYYVLIFFGVVTNLVIAISLLRCKRNGILSSVLQLAVVDILATYVGVAEIWTLNNHTWVFSTELCPFYLGSEIFYNTLVLYLIICINFHIISTVNLCLHQMQKDIKNPLTSYNEDDESEDSLVSRSENQFLNRTVIIDYRREKTDLSVFFPSVLIWFICSSLSIPQYILSNAVTISSDCTLCTILDTRYRQLLQDLLMVFRIAIPLPLLLLSLLVLIKKLFESKFTKNLTQNLLTRKMQRVQVLLFFGLSITFLYIITSVQRQLFYLLHNITQEFGTSNITSFKMPPLENITCSYFTNLISGMAHYSSAAFRSILYIIILPELKNTFMFDRLFKCSKNST